MIDTTKRHVRHNAKRGRPFGVVSSDRRSRDYLTEKEFNLLLESANGLFPTKKNLIKCGCSLMWNSGLTLRECFSLKWKDFDFAKNTISVSKFGVRSKIPLSDNSISLLAHWYTLRHNPEGSSKVFVDLEGRSVRYLTLGKWLVELGEELLGYTITTTMFRYGLTRKLWLEGKSVAEIAKALRVSESVIWGHHFPKIRITPTKKERQ